MTGQSNEAPEPRLEDLLIQTASYLEALNLVESRHLAFALRARVRADRERLENEIFQDATDPAFTARARVPSSGVGAEEDLVRLLLDWRKRYAEDIFTPWTLEEARRVHGAFPGAVDRIAAETARRTIDNITKDIRDGKLRASDPEGGES